MNQSRSIYKISLLFEGYFGCMGCHVLSCYKWIWSYLTLNSYISTLRLTRFALLQIPARSKSNNTNTRPMAFALSLTLDPVFGIHSHKTSGNAQLLHLLRRTWKVSFFHSTSVPVHFRSHFSYQKLYLCVCVNVSVCACVCMLMLVCGYWFAPFICLFIKLLCVCVSAFL